MHRVGGVEPQGRAPDTEWYRALSEQNDALAYEILGAVLLDGDGGPKDRALEAAVDLRNGHSPEP